jgi:hypothetical protein
MLHFNKIKFSVYGQIAKYFARRLVGRGQQTLEEAADKMEVVCLGATVPAITPFHWSAHLPRIKGSARHDASKVINEDLGRKVFEFRPVVAYTFNDAVLLDGSVYMGLRRHELRSLNRNLRVGLSHRGDVLEVSNGVIASTVAGATWWGHWIEDEVPLQLLANRLGTPVGISRANYQDESRYRRAFGIDEPLRPSIARLPSLRIVSDFAQNPNKTKRYHYLRKMLQTGSPGAEKVYLRRGNTGVRRCLVNEEEVVTRLAAVGFVVVDVATASPEHVIEVCRGAKMAVSVEGSHLAPLLYLLHKFGALVILNPPHQVHTTVADIGVFCGLSSGMFICEAAGSSIADFYANPNELLKFIEDVSAYAVGNAARLDDFVQQVMSLDTSVDPYFPAKLI